MNDRELTELERRERDSRFRALYEPSASSLRVAREDELTTYRAELGDDKDD